MLTKLTLTNFKGHESLVVNFSAGLVALKGANEIGKSSIYHAILYALYGSRALPLTLAETVTYDKPESSLRVVLEFLFESVSYKITRSKSGAELVSTAAGANGQPVTANGQAEVTKFVERLFGVNADTAKHLMVANQSGLKGALEGGGAVALIEKLANIDLIDRLIAKVQQELPCGSTKQLQTVLDEIGDLVAPVLDLKEESLLFLKKTGALSAKTAEIELAVSEVDTAKAKAEEAQALLRREELRKAALGTASDEAAKLAQALKRDVLPKEVSEEELSELWAAKETQDGREAALKAYKLWQVRAAPVAEPVQAGSEDLAAELADAIVSHNQHRESINRLNIAVVKAESVKILDDQCGLCGKLLQDVPEVVNKNAEADVKVQGLKLELQAAKAAFKDLAVKITNLQELEAIQSAAVAAYSKFQQSRELLKAKIGKYLDEEFNWKGATPSAFDVYVDYAEKINEAEGINRSLIKDKAVRQEREAKLKELQTRVTRLMVDEDTKEALEDLQGLELAVAARAKLAEQSTELSKQVREVRHDISTKTALHEQAQGYYLANLERRATALTLMEETVSNNGLLKRLREARPIVAARLWRVVLASVSAHFSDVRGTPSIVTRSVDSFLVDGKNAAGLSGSTLDSLGLALRMALGRTFLPSIDWLLLDEPAAGMDDDRETAMLGLLGATSYAQVVVITHSSLADSFAASVIQL
jgi:DNA repair exonuclease SbcCD ATPase subunit